MRSGSIRLEIEPGELVAAVLGPWGWVAAVVTVAVGLTVGISSMRGSAD